MEAIRPPHLNATGQKATVVCDGFALGRLRMI